MRLLITGGHSTPAERLISTALKCNDRPELVTGKFASETGLVESLEPQIAAKYHIPCQMIDTFRFSRHKPWSVLTGLLQIWRSIFQSIKLIKQCRPDVVVSFGGYVSVPVCLAALVLRVPVVVHEQTATAGLANRIVAWWANAVAISYPDSINYFPKKKLVLTGNLLRQEFEKNTKKPTWLLVKPELPIIYVTGGNQGSLAINQVIFDLVPKLIHKYQVIHQVGRSKIYHQEKSADEVRQSLPAHHRDRYVSKDWLSAEEVAWLMANAKLVISRSGANTVSEIIHQQAVSILIPLPHAAGNEQLINARLIIRAGAGVCLAQSNMNPDRLLELIGQVVKDYAGYKRRVSVLTTVMPTQSADKLYQVIKLVTGNRQKYVITEE